MVHSPHWPGAAPWSHSCASSLVTDGAAAPVLRIRASVPADAPAMGYVATFLVPVA